MRCVRRPWVTCGPVFFHFGTFKIVMEIWDFCLEISLKNHWNFSRLVCGNPGWCWNSPGEVGQWYACWYPGSLRHHDISKKILTRVRISALVFSKDFRYPCYLIIKKMQLCSVFAIMLSHQQNTHDFADGHKNLNGIFNNHVCSASHMRPGCHFQNV